MISVSWLEGGPDGVVRVWWSEDQLAITLSISREMLSLVMTMNGAWIYHSGDTDLTSEMERFSGTCAMTAEEATEPHQLHQGERRYSYALRIDCWRRR
jgi:hypothetical protein